MILYLLETSYDSTSDTAEDWPKKKLVFTISPTEWEQIL